MSRLAKEQREQLAEELLTEPKTADSGFITCMNPENMHDRTTDDMIYRQAAIDKLNERQRKLIYCFGFENDMVKTMDIAKSIILSISSAEPEQQHGRVFKGIVVEYPSYSTYPECKGKPYFSIKYTENGQEFIGYGTYKPEVLSEYLKEYFMPSAEPDNEDLIETIKNGITVSNGDGAYFSGFRNGVRWVLSLIDGKEPIYESSAEPEIIRCGQCKYAEVADKEDTQDGYTCQFHRGSIWFSGSYCSWAERRTDE